MSFGSSRRGETRETDTHVVQDVHDLHLARNGLEALDQLALDELLYDSVDCGLRITACTLHNGMETRSYLNLADPDALIAGPLDALVHEHFGISQVVELRLLLYLIICRQAEHVALRTLEDL